MRFEQSRGKICGITSVNFLFTSFFLADVKEILAGEYGNFLETRNFYSSPKQEICKRVR